MWAGKSKWSQDTEPMGEINVTPLVDVMLVLLIIFMITAPLLTQGIDVDLPETESAVLQQNIQPLVITIRANGEIFMQKHAIKIEQLAPRIKAMQEQKPGIPVFIRGDAKTPYGRVAAVMSRLEVAGIKKVGLVTEPSR